MHLMQFLAGAVVCITTTNAIILDINSTGTVF